MARIKKFAENLTQALTTFQTLINDTNPNSDYFRITEFKDTLTGGKNGFLIEGSEHLKETTEIKIQILDVEGNPIYYEPGDGVPEYYEGISKLLSVHIYEDTPIGLGKVTVLGELKTYIDENGVTRDIPKDWQGLYNVKWERNVQINKNLSNEDKVRFYRRPEVTINEIVKPIFSNVIRTVTQTGNAYGIPQIPAQGENLTNFSLPTSYLVQTDGTSFWTGSMDGSTITFPNLGFSTQFDDVVNATDATLAVPYSVNGLVENFEDEPYSITFNYLEGLDNLKTALTGSFAKINIFDLNTFVGDVARVKVFRRSKSQLADYEFVQEIQIESNEVLRDIETTSTNQLNYGIFEETSFNQYWATSSNDLTAETNQTFLFNSIKLDSVGTNSFFTSRSLEITGGTEYTLTFNVRKQSNTNSNDYIKVFLGDLPTPTDTQNIVTVTSDNSILQKSQVSANFIADSIDETRLYFEVVGEDWYISDVSLRASQETSFSPDEITFLQFVPRTLPAETFDFIFEFYDINNNYVPVLVEETKTFDGGNLNAIQKRLEIIPSANYFQFDSGSGNGNPVPPTVIFFDVVKEFLTGSVTFTSRSFDFFNNELSSSQYSYTPTPGYTSWQFPGQLNDINTDTPFLTVQNFTGSRDPLLEEIVVQFIEYTGECEGVTDSIVVTRVIDGKGGVNYELRPYNGIFIRNADPSSSLEVQAIRIDGVNEINLRSNLPAGQSAPQIHIQSGSTYITLEDASTYGYINGLQPGTTGSGELNYNAIFNRDSIDGQLKLFLIPSGSENPSASILTTITLTDLQDGLDAGVVLFDTETFTINPRIQTEFTPTFTSATASFYRRGTFEAPISCSFEIYPSMSINQDWTPEYFMYFVTHSCNPDIGVVVYDEVGNIIPSRRVGDYVYSSSEQTKQLLTSFTYTEPWTTASVNVDKLFTIVPEGKPGDESIVFEVTPNPITLTANPRGIVGDYTPSITDIRLKQGSRYLAFSSSAAYDPFYSHGQFYIATESISFENITPGNVHFTSSFGVEYTASLIVSASSNMTNLSGSVTYPLVIHPYYTSSIYTASVVVNYTKVLDGPPPIEFIVNDFAVTLQADEVQYITDYANANTQIQVKEGGDYLTYTTQSTAPGTFRINSITPTNIQVKEISSSSYDTTTVEFERFDYPFLSASALYSFTVYPFSLGPGHEYTSSVYDRTQTFVKNVASPAARNVTLTSTSETVNFDGDGLVVSPAGDIRLDAEVFNFTGSVWYQFLRDGIPYSPIQSENFFEISSGDSTAPGEIATWRVDVRDGSNTAGTPTSAQPVRAQAQITISGIKAGAEVYNVLLTNENASLVGDVWELNTTGSNTQIIATKSTEQLTHVSSFSAKTQDFLGNDIGSLGEYQVTILSKPAYITLPGGLVSGSIVPTVGNVATIGDIVSWTECGNDTNAEIVYQIDIENGRQKLYKTQSISIQFNSDGAYQTTLSNENTSIVGDVWELNPTGSNNNIRGFRGENELTHTNSFSGAQTDAYGNTGYKDQYKVTILSKPAYITLPNSLVSGSTLPTVAGSAAIGDIVSWSEWGNNTNGEIVYQIELEGRETLYKTQSISIIFNPDGPYSGVLGNENSSVVYKVSGQLTTDGTSNIIRAFRGENELTHSVSFSSPQTDAFGQTGYKDQYQVSVYTHSSHLDLAGVITAGSILTTTNNVATIENIDGWSQPEVYPTGLIIYKIELEGREFLYKTQSLSVQFEGNTGPGIVMRGVWENAIDYIGSVETTNYRRDAVIWPDPATYGETHFWAAVSGSGPGTGAGAQQPDDSVSPNFDDTSYWQYLGEQEFFVAAKIAIFEESYVKNTINVGTKDGTGAFANIVISGGRPDPYIALGQTGTIGTAGTSGTSAAPTGIIGYDRPGVFLGIYEDGANGTTGRFSIKSSGGSGTRGLFWDGSTLTIRGAIRQLSDGASEGRMLGPWADVTSGFEFVLNDVVSNNSDTWTCILGHDKNIGGDEPGVGGSFATYWEIAPIASPSLRLASDYQSFVIAKDGTVSPGTITFTATQQNLTGTPTFTTSPSVTLGGSGTTRTLTSANFGSNTAVTITATNGSLSDSITVVKLEEGSDALTVVLTNEAHTLQTANDGTVNYTDSGTDVYIYEGSTQLVYDGTGASDGTWAVSAAGTNITPPSPSDQGSYARYGDHSSMTQNQASIVYTISGKRLNGTSFSVTKTQSLSKAIQGSDGAAGTPGAGVVYRGLYAATSASYFYTSERRDVVKGTSGTYFLANNAGKSGTNTWAVPETSIGTDWANFGATFSSVATGLLLAENATITKGLVIGESGTDSGFIRSANANTIQTGEGFYISANGHVRFGDDVTLANSKYVYWDGEELSIKGTVNIDEGSVGNWVVDDVDAGGSLHDSNDRIVFNPTLPEIQLYNTSAQKKVIISPSDNLSSLGGGNISIGSISGTTPSVPATSANIVQGYGVYSAYYSGSATSFTVSTAGTYQVDDLTIIPTLAATTTGLNSTTATTSYPMYAGTYDGQSHSGWASRASYNIYLYAEISDAANGGNIIKRQQISYGNATGQSVQPSVYYWNSSGGYWQSYGGYTTAASAYNPVPSDAAFEVTFPSTGTYYFRYSARVYVSPGSSYNKQSDGSTVTTYTQTKTGGVSYGTISSIDTYVTLTFPLNFSEMSGGGFQVVTDSTQYVLIPRQNAGSSNPTLLNVRNGQVVISVDDATDTTLTNYGKTVLASQTTIGGGWGDGLNAGSLWKGLTAHSFALKPVTYASPGTSALPNTLQYELSTNGSALFFDPSSTSKYIELPYRKNSVDYHDADKFQAGQIITIINEDDGQNMEIKGLFHGGLANNFTLAGGGCLTLMYSTSTPSGFATNDQHGWFIIGYYDNTG